eukprot:TRINITY_DN5203_c1_g2_i1.p1 TRINITY_DN5203_c1_g2~~TRINITY_DN5203_c1_g2_i1.p1  ORF type:complete len:792 (-),score=182.38 TRINITY_DN5203_c1_g2_i1:128-2503(-)
MGQQPSRKFPTGTFVMVDASRSMNFTGSLEFGRVIGSCAAVRRNNWEYTIQIDKDESDCVEEDHVERLHLPELAWVSPLSREVAVQVETHGKKKFVAELIKRTPDGLFEVRFVADGSILEKVLAEQLSEPEPRKSLRNHSPLTTAPDAKWLLDRKIQDDIDNIWPIYLRIAAALKKLRTPRPVGSAVLRGPFVGKDATDSEGFVAHPQPLDDLTIDGEFVDTWAKFAGKVKFSTTYKIGPKYPRMDAWVTSIDAGEPLYFHAALPVYAGLICIGEYQGKPEWIRATDVALIGIALYADEILHPGFEDPPLEKLGLQKYGHDACHFIPGCASTYLGDSRWVGGCFCLAPMETDYEVRDDIYSIVAYHEILSLAAKQRNRGGAGVYAEDRKVTIQVDLVLSTSFLANVRTVCCGTITVNLSDKGVAVAMDRLKNVTDVKMHHQAALFPTRERKVLSEEAFEDAVETRLATSLQRLRANEAGSPQSRPGTVLTGLQDLSPISHPLALPNLPVLDTAAALAASPQTLTTAGLSQQEESVNNTQPVAAASPPQAAPKAIPKAPAARPEAMRGAGGGSPSPPSQDYYATTGGSIPGYAATPAGPSAPAFTPPPASNSAAIAVASGKMGGVPNMPAPPPPSSTSGGGVPNMPAPPPPSSTSGGAASSSHEPQSNAAAEGSAQRRPRPLSGRPRLMGSQSAGALEPWAVAGRPQPEAMPAPAAGRPGGGGRSQSPAGIGRAPSPSPGITNTRRRPLMTGAAGGSPAPPPMRPGGAPPPGAMRALSRNRAGDANQGENPP